MPIQRTVRVGNDTVSKIAVSGRELISFKSPAESHSPTAWIDDHDVCELAALLFCGPDKAIAFSMPLPKKLRSKQSRRAWIASLRA